MTQGRKDAGTFGRMRKEENEKLGLELCSLAKARMSNYD